MPAARNDPDHRAVRDFRSLHLKVLSDLFVQIVRRTREMMRLKLGTICCGQHQGQGQRKPPARR